jgi:3-isopropylmalate/(R)-2-methylmalate dehydratase small subunit
MEKAERDSFTLAVDLEAQTITDGDQAIAFDIPAYHKEKLVNGWDDIDLTLLLKDKIEAYEQSRQLV